MIQTEKGRDDYKPRLVKWNLEVADLLPTLEQEVLEHIVAMHNQVAGAEKRCRIAEMTEMAIPDRS